MPRPRRTSHSTGSETHQTPSGVGASDHDAGGAGSAQLVAGNLSRRSIAIRVWAVLWLLALLTALLAWILPGGRALHDHLRPVTEADPVSGSVARQAWAGSD